MSTKRFYLVLALLLTSFLFAGTYSGGSGAENDPFIISNKNDLKELSETSADRDKYFLQSADINFTATDFQSGGDFYNEGLGFLPIATFYGTYNGNNHSISGLTINRPSDLSVGLFENIYGASISNLDLIDCSVEGSVNVGGLIAVTHNQSIVSNCSVDGNIFSNGSSIGGLIGLVSDSTRISHCHSTGSVNGKNAVGGLVGNVQSSGIISKSYSAANVTGSSSWHGGLVGINYGTIDNCYTYGRVEGGSCSGGIIGNNQDNATITRCYSFSVVTGKVSSWTGGICGINFGAVDKCFWDVEVSGLTFSNGGAGKSTVEMKTQSTYTDSSWDFVDESTNGNEDIWDMSPTENNGYPYLPFQDPPEVSTPIDLNHFKAEYKDNAIELMWQTGSEVENLGFIIEKSILGTNKWDKIAQYNEDPQLIGSGTSSGIHNYSFADMDIISGETYEYRLSDVDYKGGIYRRAKIKVIAGCGLNDAFPNPFNPSTTLNYILPNASDIKILVFDINGRFIQTLVSDFQDKGQYEIVWYPENLSSGIYVIHMQATDLYDVQKIIYMK